MAQSLRRNQVSANPAPVNQLKAETPAASRRFADIHSGQDEINYRLSSLLSRLYEVNYRVLGSAFVEKDAPDEATAQYVPDVNGVFQRMSRTQTLLSSLEDVVESLETL